MIERLTLVNITFVCSVSISNVAVTSNTPIWILSAHFADRVAVRLGLVVDLFGRETDVFLPMLGPIEVLVPDLSRRSNIFAYNHTVDQRSDERCKAKDQENDSENPASGERREHAINIHE